MLEANYERPKFVHLFKVVKYQHEAKTAWVRKAVGYTKIFSKKEGSEKKALKPFLSRASKHSDVSSQKDMFQIFLDATSDSIISHPHFTYFYYSK